MVAHAPAVVEDHCAFPCSWPLCTGSDVEVAAVGLRMLPTCQGYARKKRAGKGRVAGFSVRRYFVLRASVLEYHGTKQDFDQKREPKGKLHLYHQMSVCGNELKRTIRLTDRVGLDKTLQVCGADSAGPSRRASLLCPARTLRRSLRIPPFFSSRRVVSSSCGSPDWRRWCYRSRSTWPCLRAGCTTWSRRRASRREASSASLERPTPSGH